MDTSQRNLRSRNLPPHLSDKSDRSEARTQRQRIRVDHGERPVLPRQPDFKAPSTADVLASLYRLEARQSFPRSSAWEITEYNAERWFVHRFCDLLANHNRLAGVDITSDEILILVYDLHHWDDWVTRWLEGRRGATGQPLAKPPRLSDYLSHGRENWGEVAQLLRELYPADEEEGADALQH